MKYILYSKNLGEGSAIHIPVIFSNFIVHSDMHKMITKGMMYGELEPISAGEISPIGMRCTGESTTMGLKSRGDIDTQIIMMIDYNSFIDVN